MNLSEAQVRNLADEIDGYKIRIAELGGLVDMLIDSQSADQSLIPIMYQTWLHKAKELKGGAD